MGVANLPEPEKKLWESIMNERCNTRQKATDELEKTHRLQWQRVILEKIQKDREDAVLRTKKYDKDFHKDLAQAVQKLRELQRTIENLNEGKQRKHDQEFTKRDIEIKILK